MSSVQLMKTIMTKSLVPNHTWSLQFRLPTQVRWVFGSPMSARTASKSNGYASEPSSDSSMRKAGSRQGGRVHPSQW